MKTEYQRIITDEGEDIELICFYESHPNSISYSPNHDEIIDKVKNILKNTGIAKMTITFLNNNLNK